MNSYILCGGTKDDRSSYIQKLSSSKTDLIHIFAEKPSISIAQIHDLSPTLSIRARLDRIVWIEEANLMTVAAQNALLKMLEEPPMSTTFYLSCNAYSSLLPTIRSRATIITLSQSMNLEDASILADLKLILGMSPGDRLQNIVKRDRTESILWLTEIESAIRVKIYDPNLNKVSLSILTKIARLAQIAHMELLANCSVSLVTQNFYLLLPHTASHA